LRLRQIELRAFGELSTLAREVTTTKVGALGCTPEQSLTQMSALT